MRAGVIQHGSPSFERRFTGLDELINSLAVNKKFAPSLTERTELGLKGQGLRLNSLLKHLCHPRVCAIVFLSLIHKKRDHNRHLNCAKKVRSRSKLVKRLSGFKR